MTVQELLLSLEGTYRGRFREEEKHLLEVEAGPLEGSILFETYQMLTRRWKTLPTVLKIRAAIRAVRDGDGHALPAGLSCSACSAKGWVHFACDPSRLNPGLYEPNPNRLYRFVGSCSCPAGQRLRSGIPGLLCVNAAGNPYGLGPPTVSEGIVSHDFRSLDEDERTLLGA